MRYEAAITWLFGLDPLGVKLGLGRMRGALARVGNPHRRYPAALVTGTNGKGSTSSYLAAALRARGLRVGLYTSPHVERFEERIQVDGRLLPRARVPALVEVVRKAGKLTFFEAVTLMAMQHFADEAVDAAVLEIGMGGRLDATNVVDPSVSAITAIGRDHLAMLGPTLADVTREKLGIARPRRPLVIGPQRPAVERALREQLAPRRAPTHRVPLDARCTATPGGWRYEDGEGAVDALRPPLPGAHQGDNLAVALLAARLMAGAQGWAPPGEQALRRAVAAVQLPARLQHLRDARGRLCIVDGAHNADAAQRLARFLREQLPGGYDLLFGCLLDKDAAALLAALGPAARRVVLTRPPTARGRDPLRLLARARVAAPAARAVVAVDDPAEAVAAALAEGSGAPLVVAGSLYLAGAALPALRAHGFGAEAPAAPSPAREPATEARAGYVMSR